ncbi:hypothetical protein [Mycobacterium sp. OAE908]|uniref:hypothetical protein n=1 Tax=Mycobacterium sp. OAE908 TaxID=2817899 RepID=UPI001AE9E04C
MPVKEYRSWRSGSTHGNGNAAESPESMAGQSAGVDTTIKRVVELITTITGYAAVLSALMLYFGYARTRIFYEYFGIPVGALHFSTTDYLLRSPDTFFRPVIWATVALAVISALSLAAGHVEAEMSAKWRVTFRCTLGIVTALAAIYALSALSFVTASQNSTLKLSAPIALAFSGALLIIQYQMYRSRAGLKPPIATVAIAVLLITGAAFWATSIYAQKVGSESAQSIAHTPHALPEVVILSKKDLPFSGGIPIQSAKSDSQQPWRSMFTGYRVLIYASDRWFLVRTDWNEKAPTVILPDGDESIQVKLLPKG